MAAPPLRAVVFDLGETLVCEQRHWGEWADYLGVPRLTFFAALGIVVERRLDHRQVFQVLRPGFDYDAALTERVAAGDDLAYRASDCYPDAVACLERLRSTGLRIGIAGNQPAGIELTLAGIGLRADLVASSGTWGLAKPSPAFFARIVDELDLPPGQIAYVGDRVDNDVVPARAAGMRAVFLHRGPWGIAQATWPEAGAAVATIESLDELPAALGLG